MGGKPGRFLRRRGPAALLLLLPLLLYLFSLRCFFGSTATTAVVAAQQPATAGFEKKKKKNAGAGAPGETSNTLMPAAPSTINTTTAPTTSSSTRTRTTTSSGSILLTPCEIYWDSVVRVALQELRSSSSREDRDDGSFTSRWKTALQSCYYSSNDTINNNINNHHNYHRPPLMLTVTLVGYKGGKLIDQINQDRAFVYYDAAAGNYLFLSGVMDGHGSLGHLVAEFARHELLQRLPPKLQKLQQERSMMDADDDDNSINTIVQQIIQQTVVDIDRDLPESMASAGGATASFVVQVSNPQHRRQQQHDDDDDDDDDTALYFSNTGDSQSFLVAAILNTTTAAIDSNQTQQRVEVLDTQIALATQPHKPDHPAERRRLEAAGMRVEAEAGYDDDGARAWYTSAADGGTYGLAMSRALGDRDAGGVTAQPDVLAVPSLRQLAAKLAQEYNKEKQQQQRRQQQEPVCSNAQVDNNSGNADDATCTTTSDDASTRNNGNSLIQQNQIHFFVVSATDGLLDYLTPEIMGAQLAAALYKSGDNNNSNNKHAMTAASDLLHQSSGQWHAAYRGEYRDDMALAVVQIS